MVIARYDQVMIVSTPRVTEPMRYAQIDGVSSRLLRSACENV